MPELPEMENYKQLLSNLLNRQTITDVEISREKSINVYKETFISQVKNNKITGIQRRGKHLLFYLNTNQVLLLHLMLGGWMFYGTTSEKPDRSVQIQLSFGNNHLFFLGLRLGYLYLLTQQEVSEKLQRLGPEPLETNFTLNKLQQMLNKKTGKLKLTLIDQSFISGIGNCYSDEICFSAGLLPMRKGKDLNETEVEKLYNSITLVLKKATEFGGYMESPLYVGDKKTGGYDPKCMVYDREKEPCMRCGSPIIKGLISSKKTFYCEVCQH